MSAPIPFAGLRPDDRRIRGAGELDAFDLLGAVRLGRALEQWHRAGEPRTVAARALCDVVHAFDRHARPACPEVGVFATGSSGPMEMVLLARAGAPPREDETPPVQELPMATELLGRLRIADASAPSASVVLVKEPELARALPDPEFLKRCSVRSMIALGATVWPGESFVVIAFTSLECIEPPVLRALQTFALYAKLMWARTAEAEAALGNEGREALRTRVLEEIVVAHEINQREVEAEVRRAIEAARAETARTTATAKEKLESEKTTLRRTQNAMLNVIEDLRAARRDLQATVEEQTRELAETNRTLEARNRELEEFVYIASHDLQEPLRTVSGYLQMIQRRYGEKLGVDADEFIQFAIDGSSWMQKLIESLLVYSRTSTREKRLELLPLDEPVDVALQNLATAIEESKATVERAPLPRIRADRVEMVQLFQNLISNAVRFAGAAPPHITIEATLSSGVCSVAVTDRGIGFNPKFADRIFKVFRRLQRDKPGTGIGLSVCKKIAERHGGSIEAHSEPGKGATFIVHLPVGATAREEP